MLWKRDACCKDVLPLSDSLAEFVETIDHYACNANDVPDWSVAADRKIALYDSSISIGASRVTGRTMSNASLASCCR